MAQYNLTPRQMLTESEDLHSLATLVTMLRGLDAAIPAAEQQQYVQQLRKAFSTSFNKMVGDATARLKTVDQRRQLRNKVQELLAPMQSIDTFKQLADYMQELLRKVQTLGILGEAINWKGAFQRVGQALKQAGAGAKQWWSNNKYQLFGLVVQFLLQLFLDIVFGLISGMLKSKISAPKIKMFKGFKGGDFGGGGAGGEW